MTSVPDSRANTSTLFDRLDAAEREKLDRAIVDRSPPTFTACFEAHQLADRGISFDAFYRYARRLRTQCELHHLAELTLPEDPSPEAIQRLAHAYRIAANVRLAADRFENQQIRERESQDKLDNLRLGLLTDCISRRHKDRPPEPPAQVDGSPRRIEDPPPASPSRNTSPARKSVFPSKDDMLDSLDIESALEARRNNSVILEGRRARASPVPR
jgi:hypothetical protein